MRLWVLEISTSRDGTFTTAAHWSWNKLNFDKIKILSWKLMLCNSCFGIHWKFNLNLRFSGHQNANLGTKMDSVLKNSRSKHTMKLILSNSCTELFKNFDLKMWILKIKLKNFGYKYAKKFLKQQLHRFFFIKLLIQNYVGSMVLELF